MPKRILENYDIKDVLIKLIEELGECAQSIAKYILKPSSENLEKLIEEIADVKLVFMQVEIYFNTKEKISSIIEYKLNRTLERIKTGFYN